MDLTIIDRLIQKSGLTPTEVLYLADAYCEDKNSPIRIAGTLERMSQTFGIIDGQLVQFNMQEMFVSIGQIVTQYWRDKRGIIKLTVTKPGVFSKDSFYSAHVPSDPLRQADQAVLAPG